MEVHAFLFAVRLATRLMPYCVSMKIVFAPMPSKTRMIPPGKGISSGSIEYNRTGGNIVALPVLGSTRPLHLKSMSNLLSKP